MPFTNLCEQRIPPDGWDIMPITHNNTSDILARDPKAHEFAELLARDIIRLYEAGERDPVIMAFTTTKVEISSVHLARGTAIS